MADEKAEQAAVDAAYEALLANVHLLGFTGNTDDLALALELAKTTNTEGKTPESVQVLKDAIAKAEEIIADGNVLQEEIDAAREALLAAIDGLEDVVLADKTKLKGLLEDSQKYVEKLMSIQRQQQMRLWQQERRHSLYTIIKKPHRSR